MNVKEIIKELEAGDNQSVRGITTRQKLLEDEQTFILLHSTARLPSLIFGSALRETRVGKHQVCVRLNRPCCGQVSRAWLHLNMAVAVFTGHMDSIHSHCKS